ncbi:MucR family transcriptional regulator [Methylobacterium currus]|jgi:predicted transcriptional regulator|uniref:MucR family transcriptional regulator n=1 Tax=Methylobacterium currus TaxID=2051553 RepID=A0A2R4WSM9_9HYPH|nr:MucR family transcriptional regulator [Methylobacterium currus]AWB24534.1 MucR family transcriptional regulator [Methylobacterium currus]UHC16322.1 MucR family transcriptional regulator [Methylobacterium currus]
MDDTSQHDIDFIGITVDIVGAYVTKNNVPASELPSLIAATYAALMKLTAPPTSEVEKPTPPIPIRKTVTPDHIISLEDGRPYKSLKRHLSSRGMTPDEYRQKWSLPRDYPMVAANYAAARSELAKSSGLGQIRRNQAAIRKAEAAAPPPARRGRPKKAEPVAE